MIGICLNSFGKDYGVYQIDKANILSIYDGDTLFVTDPSCHPVLCAKIGIRIFGIDTPEKRTRCDREKELAKYARQILVDMIERGSVIEVRNTDKEKYGRVLGDLYIDGVNYSDVIVSSGLAVRYYGEKKTPWCER
jgi:micrococcal nuclease